MSEKSDTAESISYLCDVFRQKLKELNDLSQKLVKEHHVTGSFYIGSNLTYTYLPSEVIFTRTTKERF